MPTRLMIYQLLEEIAKAQNKKLAPLSDDLALVKSGLDSLCLAIFVARMEDSTGKDPFSAADDAAFPVTVGDLVNAYELALAA